MLMIIETRFINLSAFKQKLSRMRFVPCRLYNLSIYCLFIYCFNVLFPIESKYDICFFLEKSIIKIVIQLYSSFINFQYEETKILFIAIYHIKMEDYTTIGVRLKHFRDFISQKLNIKNFRIETKIIKSLMEEKFPQEQSEGFGGARLPRPTKTSPYRLREY